MQSYVLESTSRAGVSERDCRNQEGNIVDRVATIRDGLLMLRIVVCASAHPESDFSSVLLPPLVEVLTSTWNS